MTVLRATLAVALTLPLAVSPATERHDIALADHALILGPTGYPVLMRLKQITGWPLDRMVIQADVNRQTA